MSSVFRNPHPPALLSLMYMHWIMHLIITRKQCIDSRMYQLVLWQGFYHETEVSRLIMKSLCSNVRLSEEGIESITLMDHSKVHPELVANLVKHICTTQPVSQDNSAYQKCLPVMFYTLPSQQRRNSYDSSFQKSEILLGKLSIFYFRIFKGKYLMKRVLPQKHFSDKFPSGSSSAYVISWKQKWVLGIGIQLR